MYLWYDGTPNEKHQHNTIETRQLVCFLPTYFLHAVDEGVFLS